MRLGKGKKVRQDPLKPFDLNDPLLVGYHTLGPQSTWNITTTGTTTTEPKGEIVSRIVKKHSKGYYYVINVNNTDEVNYKVYDGGKFSLVLFKLFGSRGMHTKLPIASSDIRKRTHLPATLGAAYLEIDAAVELSKKVVDHEKYIKGMLKTNPENLKMIEGLEKLQEGEPDNDSSGVSGANVSSNFTVSGSGTYSTTPSPGQMYQYNPPVETLVEKMTAKAVEAFAQKTDKEMMSFKGSMESAEKSI